MALRIVSSNFAGQDMDRIKKRTGSTTSLEDKENGSAAGNLVSVKTGMAGLALKPSVTGKQFLMPLKPAPKQVTKGVPVQVKEDETVVALTEAFSVQMLGVVDIDADDGANPQLVSDYVCDIYDYLRKMEVDYPIRVDFMSKQTAVSPRMRGILVDWLIQVHLKFQLMQETLFLTVSILDRYLQENVVEKSQLQLLGVSSLFVASKYEEMYAPEIQDCVYITDNAFTSAEVRVMEESILRTLDFSFGRPVPLQFLRRNSKAAEANAMLHILAKYLLELTLTEYDCAHLAPSHIAAAAICLSMKVLENEPWSQTMVAYSRYSESQLMPVMRILASLVVKASKAKLQAVYKKFSSSKLMKISQIEELNGAVIKDLAGVSNKLAKKF